MKELKFAGKYVRRYALAYILGIAALFFVDLMNVYIPQYTGTITDGLRYGTMTMAEIRKWIGRIAIMGAIIAAGRFMWRYFLFGSAYGIEKRLRNDMFEHLETLSMRYFNEHKTGDLMAHFTNDLTSVRLLLGMTVITAFDASVMLFLVLYKMVVYVNLKLTIISVIPLILIIFGDYFYGKVMHRRFLEKQQAFSDLTDQVQEAVSGIRVIKAFVQERKELYAFAKMNARNQEKNLGVVRLQALFMPLLDLIVGISSLLTLLYGGYLAITGDISLGQFVAFNSYITMLVWPMIATGDCINIFSQAVAAWDRISSIFLEKPDIVDLVPEGLSGQDMHIEGDIEMKNLTFTYPDGTEPVLSDINVHIKKGQMLGVLGRTGSGKSSLADLLLRIYDCPKGMLLIDGRAITDYPLEVLHRDVAYVPQENFMFSDTLEENIAFGLEERIDDHPELINEIHQAAKDACIHDNIMDFPDEYKTLVGERGVTLSGGQKQRSSIARALLMDASILILDDSLSAVDTDTEEQILENLLRLRKGKTTIVIAHRISTLSKADHVMVLEDGKMTEYGTHEELVKQGGFYADICEKQQLEQELEVM